ncbi:MAG: Imm44 family immunity protein [Opitutus sp.]
MELWTSGEIEHSISDVYRDARKAVESAVNGSFKNADFGAGLREVAYIAIIRKIDSSDFKEVKKYSSREKSAEFRLKISFADFSAAGSERATQLIAESVLRAFSLLKTLSISNFDSPGCETHVRNLFERLKWL